MQSRRLAIGISILGVIAVCDSARAQSARPDQPPSADSLPSVIPIFPLEDTTLFPNAERPLLRAHSAFM